MISMMIVPNIPHADERVLVAVFTLFSTSSGIATLHWKLYISHPKCTSFTLLYVPSPRSSSLRTSLLFEFPMRLTIAHPFHFKRSVVHFSVSGPRAVGLCKSAMIISQNESDSPTNAGTNARPKNSLRSKLSLFSLPPNTPSPMTYFSVMRGENMA